MQINMEVNLKDLSNETLCELTKASVDILKERSNTTHSNELLKKSSDDHLNAIKPVKEKTEEKKRPYKKRAAHTKDFTEVDKIVKEHYGKKRLKEIIAIAAKKGITTDEKQLDYRRKKLGIIPLRKFGRPKKTDDKYLKLIKEASEINLKGIESQKNLSDIEKDDK